MELGSLHAQLQQQVLCLPLCCEAEVPPGPFLTGVCALHQVHREGELSQKLQEEQFSLLQCAVVEAEGIILDAVAKVDDPIHVCCISSPGKPTVISHSLKNHNYTNIAYKQI